MNHNALTTAEAYLDFQHCGKWIWLWPSWRKF